MRKRCNRCGCYLDPGEWCDCDNHETTIDTPRRPQAYKPTTWPREWNSETYIRQKWLEFDMR